MELVAIGTKHEVRGLELSVYSPPHAPTIPDLWGAARGWRLNQLPMAHDLINHAYVMKPP